MSLFPKNVAIGSSGFGATPVNNQAPPNTDPAIPTENLTATKDLANSLAETTDKQDKAENKNDVQGNTEEIITINNLNTNNVANEVVINEASNETLIKPETLATEPVPSASKPLENKPDNKPTETKPVLDVSQYKTSVRIAGLNAPADAVFSSSFVASNSIINSNTSDDNSSSAKSAEYENLSEKEKEELDDLSSMYTEEFHSNESKSGGICLDDLLELAIDNEASDIHFSTGASVGLRINGHINFIENLKPLNAAQTRNLVFSLVPNPLHRKRLFENRELDCAYEHASGVNFRVNIFFKRGVLAGVLRRIASHAMTLEQLGLPDAVKRLLKAKQGLLLVTGPTGSGKSTSMQSMLELINETRVEHILTIEDPIEFLFTSKKSIFSQREIGRDTHSFPNALRAALREDPDIVMIGEMRDAETIQAAMSLSETGHLVISTLHTSSAPQTVARLVSNFPSSEQEQVQSRLADTLIGVLSQRLVPRKDRSGRVGLYELMIVNSAIRNIIRTGEMSQIHNAMIAGREVGMVRMQDFAQELGAQGIVDPIHYENFFREE